MSTNGFAQKIMDRIGELGRISEEPDRLTRTYGSPAMRRANDLTGSWMREAGMTVREDAFGNLIGRYPGEDDRVFLLGSHLDTVPDAGKFDGPLGVLLAIACVEHLHEQKVRLPFALEVVAFADKEGARFQAACPGSRAMAGTLTDEDLARIDARDITLAEAIRAFGGDPEKLASARREPQQLLGYAEVHIEEGPVLERKYQPVGIVTAIAGQTGIRARFAGQTGHAGTTPMALRHDALAAAAQFITEVETCANAHEDLAATVGQIETKPGASDAIPGEVILSLDVRHPQDAVRQDACATLLEAAQHIARKRGLTVDWDTLQDIQSVPCSRELSNLLARAARKHLMEVTELPSGAGHDAAAMGDITPVTMLLVRCKAGVSHHRDESASAEDVGVAMAVLNDFLQLLANQQYPFSGRKHGAT